MPRIIYEYKEANTVLQKKNSAFRTLPIATFETFDEKVLGLGNVAADGTYHQALVAVFDLEGFTAFCNQPDSHLVIPDFLKRFLKWLFSSLRSEAKAKEENGTVFLWNELPFYVKFMGDGLLVIWDTKSMETYQRTNVVISIKNMLTAYREKFLPMVKQHVSNPPGVLRCGIARGQVISVGNGQDFVGSCINIASRLQKLSTLSFALSRRGFDISAHPQLTDMILKKASLDGVGAEELFYVSQSEFKKLSSTEKALFSEP